MISKNLVLIPFWIEKVLSRKSLPISESLNYSKLRSFLSPNDLSAFLNFQFNDRINVFKLNSALYKSWEQSSQDDERVELDSTVVPLSCKEEAAKYVSESFNINLESSQERAFKVIDFDRNNVGIVIYPEYLNRIYDRSFQLLFLESLLESYYKSSNAYHDVSQTELFGTYLSILNDEIFALK